MELFILSSSLYRLQKDINKQEFLIFLFSKNLKFFLSMSFQSKYLVQNLVNVWTRSYKAKHWPVIGPKNVRELDKSCTLNNFNISIPIPVKKLAFHCNQIHVKLPFDQDTCPINDLINLELRSRSKIWSQCWSPKF